MNDSATVAQLIKERMRINGITNKKLAESIKNVNVNTIAQLAKGREISYVTFAEIADFLNCSVDYLLGRTDKPDMTITVNQTGEIIEASPINAINNAGQPLSEMTAELVKMFEAMDFSNKMKVMNFVIDLKGNKKGADRP